MNPETQVVFLETSIQVQRALASRSRKLLIEQYLTNPAITAITSAYVWMEYQRSVIADYAHVHRVMGNQANWGALFEHVLDGDRAFHPRSAVRCTKLIGQLYHVSKQDYERAQQLLSVQVAYDLRHS